MHIHIQAIADEVGYPKDVFISDEKDYIGSYKYPARMTILDAQDIFNALEPLIEKYRVWQKQYAEYHESGKAPEIKCGYDSYER